jgi:hypothetical protein
MPAPSAVATEDANLDLEKNIRKLLKAPNTPLPAVRDALRFYTAALELPNPSGAEDPADRAQILINRAAAWLKLDECRQAMADVDAALQLDPASPRIHAYKGELLLKLRQYKAASEVFLAGLNIDSSSGRLKRGFETSLSRMREVGHQYCPKFAAKQGHLLGGSDQFDPYSALDDKGILQVLQRNRVCIVDSLKEVLTGEAAFWEREGLPARFWAGREDKKKKKKTKKAKNKPLASQQQQQQTQQSEQQQQEQQQQEQQEQRANQQQEQDQQEQDQSYEEWEWERMLAVLREYRELLQQAFATYCEEEDEDEEEEEDEEAAQVAEGQIGSSPRHSPRHSPRAAPSALSRQGSPRAGRSSELPLRAGSSLGSSLNNSRVGIASPARAALSRAGTAPTPAFARSSSSMGASTTGSTRQLTAANESGGGTAVATPLFVPISIALQMSAPQLWKVIIDSKLVTHRFTAAMIGELLQQRHYRSIGIDRNVPKVPKTLEMGSASGGESGDAAASTAGTSDEPNAGEIVPVPPAAASPSRARISAHRKRNPSTQSTQSKVGAGNARHTGAAVQAAEMAREAKRRGGIAPLTFPEFVYAVLRLTDERYRPRAPRKQEREEEEEEEEESGAADAEKEAPTKSVAARNAEQDAYITDLMPVLPTFSMRVRFSLEMHFVEALGEQQQQRRQRRERRERERERQERRRQLMEQRMGTSLRGSSMGSSSGISGDVSSSANTIGVPSPEEVALTDFDLDSEEVQQVLHQHEHKLRAIFHCFAVADRERIEGGRGHGGTAQHGQHHALMDIREFLYMLRELQLVDLRDGQCDRDGGNEVAVRSGSSVYDASVLTMDEGCRIIVAVAGFIGDPDADRFDFAVFSKGLAHCCQLASYDAIVPFPRRFDNFIKNTLCPNAAQQAGINLLW